MMVIFNTVCQGFQPEQLIDSVCYDVFVMAVRKLSSDERARIAEKMMELANLTVAALGIGQILSREVQLFAAVCGIIIFLVLYYLAVQIMKRG